MAFFSTVTGYLIDKFRGGSLDVAIHQSVEGGKPGTSMSGFAPGLEINPADGENIIVTKIKGSNSFVVSIGGVNQNIAPNTARGERRLYSVSEDGSEIKAIAKFKNDGVLELNGATDSAVLFSELKTAYDELNDKFNSFVDIMDGIISGVPILEPGNGAASVFQATLAAAILPFNTPPLTINSEGDITPAESADVKLS